MYSTPPRVPQAPGVSCPANIPRSAADTARSAADTSRRAADAPRGAADTSRIAVDTATFTAFTSFLANFENFYSVSKQKTASTPKIFSLAALLMSSVNQSNYDYVKL